MATKLFVKFIMAIGHDLYMPVDERKERTTAELPLHCWGYQYVTHEVINWNGETLTSVEPVNKGPITYVGVKARKGEVFWDIGEDECRKVIEQAGVDTCVICTHPSRGTMIYPLYPFDDVIHADPGV